MSVPESAKVILEEGGRELALEALRLGYERLVQAIEQGDLSPIYEDQAEFDALEQALVRQRLVQRAWRDKDARETAQDQAFREGLESLGKIAARVGLTLVASAL